MDLTPYYESYANTYRLGVFTVIFAFIVIGFLIMRTLLDKSEKCRPVWRRVVYCLGYLLIFASVLGHLFFGGMLGMKQDVDEGTIYGYEGEFEIVELKPGLYKKAVFSINGEDICLKYFDGEGKYEYDPESIQPGTYTGKLVYGKHTAEVIYVEIIPPDGENHDP